MARAQLERFGTDVSPELLFETLERDGCAIVDGLLEPQQLTALNRELEALTPTDLVLDADVAARWLLISEEVGPRFETEVHALSRAQLAHMDEQLVRLGVTKNPTW